MRLENIVKKFIEIVEESNIEELEVRWFFGCRGVRITRYLHGFLRFSPSEFKQIKEQLKYIKKPNLFYVESSMVGTFYFNEDKKPEPRLKVGKIIKKGEPIFYVESKKIMERFVSQYDAIVVKILIDNDKPIEYGQLLFFIGAVGEEKT